MTHEIEKEIEAAAQEAFAMFLSAMPDDARDDLCGDHKLKKIMYRFFQMGFIYGNTHGTTVCRQIVRGER